MRRELAAVYEELVRRQKEGDKSVFLSDDSVNFLRDVAKVSVEASRPVAVAPPEVAPSEAVPPPPVKKVAVKKAAKPKIAVPVAPTVELVEGDKQAQWDALKVQVLAGEWCLSQVKPG